MGSSLQNMKKYLCFLKILTIQSFIQSLNKNSPLGAKYSSWSRAAYLIITKKILVIASAPYALHESFFHQGEKYTFSNSIRGIFKGGWGIPLPWFDSSGAYASYAPWLDTPLLKHTAFLYYIRKHTSLDRYICFILDCIFPFWNFLNKKIIYFRRLCDCYL